MPIAGPKMRSRDLKIGPSQIKLRTGLTTDISSSGNHGLLLQMTVDNFHKIQFNLKHDREEKTNPDILPTTYHAVLARAPKTTMQCWPGHPRLFMQKRDQYLRKLLLVALSLCKLYQRHRVMTVTLKRCSVVTQSLSLC